MSATAYLSRVLQMLCQPLQGAYSTGAALVQSASAPVTLQPGDILVPIIDDCETEAAAVKVDPNPATADHSWPIVDHRYGCRYLEPAGRGARQSSLLAPNSDSTTHLRALSS